MRTPAGTECRYFYGDYHRGRKLEECRLIGNLAPPRNWTSDLCRDCPVPSIIMANACPNLVLQAEVKNLIFNLRRRVKVTAFCTKTQQSVNQPKIGCGQCHPLPPVFEEKIK